MFKSSLVTLAVLLLLTVPVAGQQKREIRVLVNIVAHEVIKNQFVSKVHSALRSLGDVVVVNSDTGIGFPWLFWVSVLRVADGPAMSRPLLFKKSKCRKMLSIVWSIKKYRKERAMQY